MPTADRVLMRLEDVSVEYGGVAALTDVRLALRPGETLGLIGPNGAGKSTMMSVIAGTVTPTRGSVWLGRKRLGRAAPYRRARLGIGRSFQHPSLFESLTVAENVTVAAGAGRSRGERQDEGAAVAAVLHACSLTDWTDVTGAELPYGIKKRTDIARALVRRPELVLLDEPCAGLNSQEKAELRSALSAFLRQHSLAAVVVEHDVEFVMAMSERLVALDLGKVVAEGDPERVRTDPRVVEAFLGGSAC